jgi:hypothetical protein
MNAYSIALFIHILSLLAATVAMSLATLAGVRLRGARTSTEATAWLALNGRVVPVFPIASLGLLASGVYMTQASWTWSTPWIDAALVGLALIVALGSGIEGSRGRALTRELESAGLSPRARRMLRDPVSWSAKLTTLTLFLALVFVMTLKPAAIGCLVTVSTAVMAGVVSLVVARRAPGRDGRPAESPEPVSS